MLILRSIELRDLVPPYPQYSCSLYMFMHSLPLTAPCGNVFSWLNRQNYFITVLQAEHSREKSARGAQGNRVFDQVTYSLLILPLVLLSPTRSCCFSVRDHAENRDTVLKMWWTIHLEEPARPPRKVPFRKFALEPCSFVHWCFHPKGAFGILSHGSFGLSWANLLLPPTTSPDSFCCVLLTEIPDEIIRQLVY